VHPLARRLDAARGTGAQGPPDRGDGGKRGAGHGAGGEGRARGRLWTGGVALAGGAARGTPAHVGPGVPERASRARGGAALRGGQSMNVLVLHGPTLSFRQDLGEVDRRLAERARALGHVLRTVQTHHEGTVVDALWEQRHWAQGVLLNPGPLALGSHVLREAVAAGKVPVVEVLTVGPKDRAGLAKKSLPRAVCAARLSGAGAEAYLAGLDRLSALATGRKSLGRTPVPSAAPSSAARKAAAAARSPIAEPPRTAPAPAS